MEQLREKRSLLQFINSKLCGLEQLRKVQERSLEQQIEDLRKETQMIQHEQKRQHASLYVSLGSIFCVIAVSVAFVLH